MYKQLACSVLVLSLLLVRPPAAEADTCSFTLDSIGQRFNANGGTGSVTVTTSPFIGCSWAATSNATWITDVTIVYPSVDSSSGIVNYSVAANSGDARLGTITIAGLTFTV